MRVLYIEDDPRDADLVRRELIRNASSETVVDIAANVAEARARLRAAPPYDLALIDLQLPGEGGFELLREIRGRALPTAVVIVTGEGDEGTAVAALKAGADDYVAKKPGFAASLPVTVEAALARFRAEATRLTRGLRVLYAEHQAIDIDLTRRHLATHAPHIRLEVVHSAREVLARLPERAEAPGPYDVLLLDYRLPGESALELLKTLHDHRRSTVPVILVTGQGDEEVAAQALRLGAADYLSKHSGYLYELPVALENAHHRARLASEQAALCESEDRYRDLVENSGDLICTHDLSGTLLSVNRAIVRATGYPVERLVGRNLTELMPPAASARFERYLERIRDTAQATGVLEVRAADGRALFFEYHNTLRTEGVDEPIVRGMARDVTDRRVAERALRESRARLDGVIESAMDAIVSVDADQRVVLFNAAAEKMFRCSRDEAVGEPIERFLPERFRAAHRDHIERFARSGQTNRAMGQFGLIYGLRSDGEEFPIEASISQTRAASTLLTVILRDVTRRVQAREELVAARERLSLAVDAANVGLWDWNLATNRVRYSTVWKRQIGYADDEIADDFEEWRSRVHPDDLSHALAAVEKSLAEHSGHYRTEFRLRHKDGSYRNILAAGRVFVDDQGAPERMVGSHIDLTDRVALEKQFRHAQKLESVGRLAGGVAHDFNNLLTVINNYVELAQVELDRAELDSDAPVREMIREIGEAGRRATRLTRQLLAFSSRQVVEAVVLDFGATVTSMAGMLRRLLGEDIALVVDVPRETGRVRADPGQVEQVLMNLVVNARDAMPDGGRLTVETSNVTLVEALPDGSVPAGAYVCLVVQDSGIGMGRETREHLFEPFFTTKEKGKGTGLGLATVHGIVKQCSGHIRVESRLGHGARFEIYLPRVDDPVSEPVREHVPSPASGGGTIVVVEDEPAVRELTRRLLEHAGYDVLVAPSGDDAMSLLATVDRRIDLLITDVVMPGISGFELARQASESYPGLRVLFTSGYSEELTRERGVKGEVHDFLSKPYRLAELRSKVGEILARNR